MVGDVLRGFERALVLQVGGDAGRPEGVVADPGLDAGAAALAQSIRVRDTEWSRKLISESFATVGESDSMGDEKFFALSRQAQSIPIVATQSLSSLRSWLPGEFWRTLLPTFRTNIFLPLSDDFSAPTASELCGKEVHLKLSYSLSKRSRRSCERPERTCRFSPCHHQHIEGL